jgi:hypothetical protein
LQQEPVGYFLYDLAGDLAVARGGNAVKTDPMERPEGLSIRRRLAAILWIPGATAAVAVGSGFDNWYLGALAFVVLLAALWLFAERGDRVWARLTRR